MIFKKFSRKELNVSEKKYLPKITIKETNSIKIKIIKIHYTNSKNH